MPLKINLNSPSPSDLAARARELAAHAEALASAITALHFAVRAAHDQSVRRTGFRCDTATGQARAVARELRDTADELDRIASAAAPGTCPIPWGVWPEHGNTLTSSGGRTWCRDPRCGRSWSHDRTGLPCTKPTRWTVTDQHGDTRRMCDGHALDAAKRLDGARSRRSRQRAGRSWRVGPPHPDHHGHRRRHRRCDRGDDQLQARPRTGGQPWHSPVRSNF
jgi:hypothetical protein